MPIVGVCASGILRLTEFGLKQGERETPMSKKLNMLFGAGAIIAGYIAYNVVPNLFYRRGYTSHEMDLLTIAGHRGGAGLGRENTLSCIERGIEAGADVVEVDVHLTQDGEVVVCHDKSIDRTTNGMGNIADLTLAEVQSFHVVDDAGNPTPEFIPTLAEVLETVSGRCKLLIEIKHQTGRYEVERKVVETVHSFGASEWVSVQSFSDESLAEVHRIDPSIKLEKLLIFRVKGLPAIYDGGFASFDYEKYSYISSFNFYYRSVTRRMIETLHEHGKEVKIWTLVGPEDTPHLPVDGIITDRPDLWRKNRKAGTKKRF